MTRAMGAGMISRLRGRPRRSRPRMPRALSAPLHHHPHRAPTGAGMRPLAGALLALASAALPAAALAQTPAQAPAPAGNPAISIADLRADLDLVAAELQMLRAMLKQSGAAGYASAGGPDVIARLDHIEATLRRLTGQAETARNRIEALADDTALRLDDLEFRLCQLDAQCDLGALMSDGGGLGGHPGTDAVDLSLGGDPRSPASPVWDGAAAGLFDLPVSAAERSDFDAAQTLAQAGDHAAAAFAFGEVAEDHAGGPLFAEARFREGQELLALGDRRGASRAWTDVFAADPAGPRAPEALFGVARITAEGGQTEPACLFLSEVILRYGTLPRIAGAAPLYDQLDCDAVLGLASGPGHGAGLDAPAGD